MTQVDAQLSVQHYAENSYISKITMHIYNKPLFTPHISPWTQCIGSQTPYKSYVMRASEELWSNPKGHCWQKRVLQSTCKHKH